MTIAQVIAQGWQAPSVVGLTPAKASHMLQVSQARYALLPWVMVARKRNLLTAGARFRRKAGLPLTPCATPRQARKRRK